MATATGPCAARLAFRWAISPASPRPASVAWPASRRPAGSPGTGSGRTLQPRTRPGPGAMPQAVRVKRGVVQLLAVGSAPTARRGHREASAVQQGVLQSLPGPEPVERAVVVGRQRHELRATAGYRRCAAAVFERGRLAFAPPEDRPGWGFPLAPPARRRRTEARTPGPSSFGSGRSMDTGSASSCASRCSSAILLFAAATARSACRAWRSGRMRSQLCSVRGGDLHLHQDRRRQRARTGTDPGPCGAARAPRTTPARRRSTARRDPALPQQRRAGSAAMPPS